MAFCQNVNGFSWTVVGIILNNVKNKLIHLVFSLVTNDVDYERNHEFLRAKRKSEQAMSAQLKTFN